MHSKDKLADLPAVIGKKAGIEGKGYGCDVNLLNHWVLLEGEVLGMSLTRKFGQISGTQLRAAYIPRLNWTMPVTMIVAKASSLP